MEAIYNVEARHSKYGSITRTACNHREKQYQEYMVNIKDMPYITVYRKAGLGKRNYKIQVWEHGVLVWEKKDK